MKKIREFLSRPAVTAVLLTLALALLGGSAIGGTRAALTIQSDYYNSHVDVYDIGVALEESNDGSTWNDVSAKKLMTALLGNDTKLKAGKKYTEMLRVVNRQQGENPIDEYVRVAVYRYWVDKDGTTKFPAMDSEWIHLEFLTGNGWSIDRCNIFTWKEDERPFRLRW